MENEKMNLFFTIAGAIAVTARVMGFLFWLDDPRNGGRK
jgi:hypothetical protein